MSTQNHWKITLLYDGQCPLCMREVNFLRRKDSKRGLVRFVDIAAADYDPQDNAGISYEAAMGRIHGILADGTVLQNVAVFRYVYEVLGMGWVYRLTKIPLFGKLADVLYGLWAKYRLQLTGRSDLATLVQERRNTLNCQSSDRCRLEADRTT